MRIPPLAPATPVRGNRFSRALGRLVLRALGFRFAGEFPPVARGVLVAAPHTSNWDFLLGIAAMFALGLRVDWLGKHTLFRPAPVGAFLRWLGGIPVDRRSPERALAAVQDLFATRERLLVGIAPEGTRGRVERWKSGFHRIARAARVPIVPVALDWGGHAVRLLPAFEPTDDYERDVAALRALFTREMALRPEGFWGG